MDEPEFVLREGIEETIRAGVYLDSLTALRDYIAHELEANRCGKCQSSQLRTGDQASLILRLQKIIEEIEVLQRAAKSSAEGKGAGNVTDIRTKRTGPWSADAENSRHAGLGTKSGPRTQNGRKPRLGSG